MESWRTGWSELPAAGRAHWSDIAAGDYLTVEQLRRQQYEGLMMTGQMTNIDDERRVLVPGELRRMTGHQAAIGA